MIVIIKGKCIYFVFSQLVTLYIYIYIEYVCVCVGGGGGGCMPSTKNEIKSE